MEFRNGVCGAERKSQGEGCEERLSCSSRDSAEPHREDEIRCLLSGSRPEVPWIRRTCRGPGCVPSPESTSCHNRPESLLVTHLLPLPKACGLSCLTGDRSFPRALLCPGTCVEAAASSKMKHPFMQVSPHLAAVNHALPTTIPITKKQQCHLPEASSWCPPSQFPAVTQNRSI